MRNSGIVAFYVATSHIDYLESSVRSIQAWADRILIGVRSNTAIDHDTLQGIERIPGIADRLDIVHGHWTSTEQCLNALTARARTLDATHALILGPQDVYARAGIEAIAQRLRNGPQVGQLQVRSETYWQGPRYRIEPPDPTLRVIATRLGPDTAFINATETNENPIVHLSEDLVVRHDFTYASPASIVVERLVSEGYAAEAVHQWMENVWNAWGLNPALRNLHPGRAGRFRAAARVHPATLPESLVDHPHLEWDVVGDRRTEPPRTSIIVADTDASSEANSGFSRLGPLVRTLPADCELIVCAPESRRQIDSQRMPGLVHVTLPVAGNRAEAWRRGAGVARSNRMIFIASHAHPVGDWVDGFTAAFADGTPNTIYVARTANVEPRRREHVYETTRGRYFGRKLPLETAVDLESAACWGLVADDRGTMTPAAIASQRFVQLQDIVVFDDSDAQAAAESSPNVEAPVDSPLASIVIPVYNNLALTQQCLESIARNTSPGTYEVIVVDNGSTDGTAAHMASAQSPTVRYIRNLRNLFFGLGCNRGAWAARGEHLVFLNNDTLVKPGWLEELLRIANANPEIGIVGNKQLFPDSHPACAGKVWHAGMVIGEDRLPWHIYYGFDPDHPLVNEEKNVQAVSGCCFLIRRALFEQLEGFDPVFQNGFEDVDLCLRAGTLGHRIHYAPRSEIIHFVSSTESRFDRDAANLEHFKARWADRIEPDEAQRYKEAALLPPSVEPGNPRVGFVTTIHQQGTASRLAEDLLSGFPMESTVVLGEFGVHDRRTGPKSSRVPPIVRCWDRTGTWYYPLIRWTKVLALNVVHVNFDPALFPAGFLEALAALRNAGKRVVATLPGNARLSTLECAVAQICQAVVVDNEQRRLELVLAGLHPAAVHSIPHRPVKDAAATHWTLYTSLLDNATHSALPNPSNFAPLHERSDMEHVLEAVRRRVQGDVIEFGSRSPWLTGHLRPTTSVASMPEFKTLCALRGIATPVLTTEEFTRSELATKRFDTILIHLSNRADSCMSLVLGILPRLDKGQQVLFICDETESRAQRIANEVVRQASARFQIERHRVTENIVLLEIRNSGERPAAPSTPRARVRWEGPQMVNHSLALVNREMELALLRSDAVELSIEPTVADSFGQALGANMSEIPKHYGRRMSGPADIHVRHQWPPSWTPPNEGRFVLIQPWEYGALPRSWVEEIQRSVDEVWTPSTFVRDRYVESGIDAARVHVVPNGVDTDRFKPGVFPYPTTCNRSFKFLFVGGTIHRKGIDVLLAAYRRAFSPTDDVALVVKDMGRADIYKGQGIGAQILEMAADPSSPSVVYLDRDLDACEMAGLYNACDCLVHPYRGEGFALPVLEAMACGLPVVVTRGGATDDFVDDETGFRIPAHKAVFGNREISGLKTVGDLWLFEPDTGWLAEKLRDIFEHRDAAQAMGARARAKVLSGWTWSQASAKALERIRLLRHRPVFRSLPHVDAAVLLDIPGIGMAECQKVVDSLLSTSYAALHVFVRLPKLAGNNEAARVVSNATRLDDVTVQDAVERIRNSVRTPHLVVVTAPVRFTKHWFQQLQEASAALGPDAIVTPTLVDADTDEASFQKRARQVWRAERGKTRPVPDISSGCALLPWSCAAAIRTDSSSLDAWLQALVQHSATIYQVSDTCVANFPQAFSAQI